MGAKAYSVIEKYVDKICKLPPSDRTILEIGSERNEGSTTFLWEFCNKHKYKFFTVDFNREATKRAQAICGPSAYCMRGEDFLSDITLNPFKIAFAYLDNFDLITYDGRTWEQRTQLYKEYGFELNNHNSKLSHFAQAVLINAHKASFSAVLFDDTWINKIGEYEGKGGYAVPYMLSCGWQLTNSPKIGVEELDSYVLLEKST